MVYQIDTLHLLLDGYGCDEKKLRDMDNVYDFLNKLPNKLRMTKMMQPYVVKWKDPGCLTPGLTGFVTIAESHLAVHTFPDDGRVYADIFSCKQFDTGNIEKYFHESFLPKKMQVRTVRRHDGIQGVVELHPGNGRNGGWES